MGNCKRCDKKFKDRAIGTKLEKKFCSDKCRCLSNVKEYYEKNKHDPEYQKKRKEWFNNWLEKNREHFNDLVREPNRINRKKNYDKFKKLRLCVKCGKKKERRHVLCCNKCGKNSYENFKKRRLSKQRSKDGK